MVYRPLVDDRRRTVDIAFTKPRLAIQIDGCFWHGCPEHYVLPKTNSEYWVEKVRRNAERDADTDARLRANGWSVLRFWEHEPVEVIVQAIEQELRGPARGKDHGRD